MEKLASSVLAACAAAALSAHTAASVEYYVVLDWATNRCAIVDERPKSGTRAIDDRLHYKTRSEAEAGMKAIEGCRMLQANSRNDPRR